MLGEGDRNCCEKDVLRNTVWYYNSVRLVLAVSTFCGQRANKDLSCYTWLLIPMIGKEKKAFHDQVGYGCGTTRKFVKEADR